MRSEGYQSYFKYLDKAGGFFYERYKYECTCINEQINLQKYMYLDGEMRQFILLL
jgi:hypothetical protein